MAVLPKRIKKRVEWQLRSNGEALYDARQQLRQALDDADTMVGGFPTDPGMPRSSGARSDPAARRALSVIEAEEKLAKAQAWCEIITDTYACFAGTQVAVMALHFFSEEITMKDLSDHMRVDVQTISEWRERFVCTCALIAAERGVLQVGGLVD